MINIWRDFLPTSRSHGVGAKSQNERYTVTFNRRFTGFTLDEEIIYGIISEFGKRVQQVLAARDYAYCSSATRSAVLDVNRQE